MTTLPSPAGSDPGAASGLILAWRIARREMRTGLKGFRVFLACLALGVASIAAVGSLSQSVKAGLMADAQVLLGGDVSVRMQHRPTEGEALAYLQNNVQALSSVIEMKAMAQTDTARALVELKAVDGRYPLSGQVVLEPPSDLQNLLRQKDGPQGKVWGAAVESGLLAKLGLEIGALVRVGEGHFQIRAVIAKEPDRVASIVNFGPRFMVATAALADTGLVQLGSQIRYFDRALLAPGQDPKTFIEQLHQAFPEQGWRVSGPEDAAPGLQRFVERLTLFLTFAGLTALLVGGIGVLGSVRSYLETKTETIATLKCLGAPGALVFQAYLLQVLSLSALGILIGLSLGAALPFIGIELVREHLPVAPQMGLFPLALMKAAIFGFLVSLTFALWPLAQARETPAANLFRTNVMPNLQWPRLNYVLAVAAGVVILAALVIVWAEEKRFAVWFVLVSAVTILLLRLGASAVMQAAKRVPRPDHAMLRLVLANLHRPGTSTPGVVLALGVGLSVLVAVALIQGNITRQVEDTIPEQAPAFFFIDIQPHQVAAFDAAVSGVAGTHDLVRMPSMRGRIVAINGVPVDQVDIASSARWAVQGDRALTYAAKPAEGAEFEAGEWWAQDYQGPPLISFDADVARGFGIGLGDTLTVNVMGRDITATIASLRTIDWRTLRFDFATIFSPGTLEGAPHTHIAAIKAPASAEAEIERTVALGFPNISTIRVRDALEAANRIIQGIAAAITGTASVTVLAGIIVLAGTIAATRTRRVYDSVAFKVLGATRRQILGAFLLEYGLLGLFTGIVGAGVGTLISWAVIVEIMGMAWVFLPLHAAITVLMAMIFTTLAGFFGTWRALGERAGSHLRNE
ncbi:MAG: FtsX-like permease family protein [Rhodospirillales bacterium]|nr:FtsX-like permease family protein [Rhodospirillales bacterium]